MNGKRIAARLRAERGFTIVEAIVALGIVFVLVIALLRTMDTGVRVIVETKRQAAATAFASELLERARSLEWNHMGLTAVANGSTCPDQVGCSAFSDPPPAGVFGADLAVNGSGNWAFGGEEIVFVNGATFDPFLSFHDQQTRDDTPFERYLFVTSVRTDPADAATERYRRITAIVTWNSPSGLPGDVHLSTLVSPFTEPSQPLIHGEVTLDGGFLSVSGRVPGTSPGGGRGLFEASVVFADGAADDDAVSASPLDDTNPIPTPLPPALQITGAYPNDFTLADLSNLLAPEATTYRAELWTEHNPLALDPKVDGLPYADFGLQSADRTNGGFIEYTDPAVQLLYAGSGDPLDQPFYEFAFFARGHDSIGPALDHTATVDRYNAPTDDRRIWIDYDWASEPIYLFPDSAGPQEDNTFQGWIIIETPDVSGVQLAAGESAARPPSLSISGDVVVKVWDPAPPGKYDTVYSGFGAVGACSALPAADLITIDDGSGGPLTWDITADDNPQLHYEIQGTILVREPCHEYTEDANLDVSEARVHATGMVTGTISYLVVDTLIDATADGTLYDVELSFDLGGVGVTALYIDPEAS
jgi:hypothetical protein